MYDGRQPKKLFHNMFDSVKMTTALSKGFAMIAPLWTDNDGRSGNVFYNNYDSSLENYYPAVATTVFQRAQSDIRKYSSYTDVTVSWVGVVTWSKMIPRMWYNPLLDKVR